MTIGVHTVELDCRGMQCPAPILQIAMAAREVAPRPAVLHVYADDRSFPGDLEAWCRTASAGLKWSEPAADGAFHGVVALNGAPLPSHASMAASMASAVSAPLTTSHGQPSREIASTAPAQSHGSPAPASPRGPAPVRARNTEPVGAPALVDLSELQPHVAVIHLSNALQQAPDGVRVTSRDPTFPASLYPWASATRAEVSEARHDNGRFTATVRLLPEVIAATRGQAPAVAAHPQPAPLALAGQGKENLATLLVFHNDLEALLATMLTANACAAQGMEVIVFFSFWGLNVLRGVNPNVERRPTGFLQRMMQMMMPRGPRRQVLGKMNMGGMGTTMMQYFMSRNNVIPLHELIRHAVDQGVRFQICTMSMEVMGLQEADFMALPNIEYSGITAFTESARRSSLNMVF